MCGNLESAEAERPAQDETKGTHMDDDFLKMLLESCNEPDEAEKGPGVAEDPGRWVGSRLAHQHFGKRPGEPRWRRRTRDKGMVVTTGVAVEGDFVVVESSTRLGFTPETVDQVRIFQMLRQGTFKLRGFVRAEIGHPFAFRTRVKLSDDLDLERLVRVGELVIATEARALKKVVLGLDDAEGVWAASRQLMVEQSIAAEAAE